MNDIQLYCGLWIVSIGLHIANGYSPVIRYS